jgi:hypothetical protein
MKWTKENIDKFFYQNKEMILENNILIPHKKLISLWREYDRWYQAINIKSNHAYENMDDFKQQHNITKINPNKKYWTINKIHNWAWTQKENSSNQIRCSMKKNSKTI